jgi:uncharacterized membrane protein
MNRERMARTRMTSTGTTSLGLNERLERALIYPISFLIGWLFSLLLPFGWLFVVIPGLLLIFLEKNRNVRLHARQAMVVFGSLSVVLLLVHFLQFLLGHIPLLGLFTGLVLGLVGAIIFWVMILLAVWLLLMAFFRPNYRLPIIGKYLGY